MLPAREGDCLWIRYGEARKPYQVLIDGGRSATGKVLSSRFTDLPRDRRTFEVLIITHIDRDHIEGILRLLEDHKLGVTFKDIWFNGYDHLRNAQLETFGAVQGERLSTALINRKLPWNRLWKGKAVCLGTNGLKQVGLAGGMQLTVLSPDREKLEKLIPVWKKECRDAGLIPGARPSRASRPDLEQFGSIDIEQLAASPFKTDRAEPNGSSIAVLAEYRGKRVLLLGDAHCDRIIKSVRVLNKGSRRLKVDALKIAHHGSEGNLSAEVLKLLNCPRYLISTNGSYFKHPSPAALARVVRFGGGKFTLYFNYRTPQTEVWDNPTWQKKYGFKTVYPDTRRNGSLTIAL